MALKKVARQNLLPAAQKIAAGKKTNKKVARKKTVKPASNEALNAQGSTN